jgi:hypothetical protein
MLLSLRTTVHGGRMNEEQMKVIDRTIWHLISGRAPAGGNRQCRQPSAISDQVAARIAR